MSARVEAVVGEEGVDVVAQCSRTTSGTSAERTIWKPVSEMSQPITRSESG